ncbi:unnamed protein product [Colias eurytheme]|nr:unnamed protein product [Colias eurytheme]
MQPKMKLFSLGYVAADGTVVSERGRLVPTKEDGEYVLITEGEIRYIGEDGKLYVTKFTADLDGTHMEGDHLPVALTPQ